MKQYRLLLALAVLLIITAADLSAKQFRVAQIPNGSVNACANCHVSPNGGGSLNDFGNEAMKNLDKSGNVKWTEAFAGLDSDGDGYSNGLELQDEAGTWRVGDENPGNTENVYNPGDPTSRPNTNSVDLYTEIQINLIAPNPVVDLMRITFTQNSNSEVEVDILDISGNIVYNANKQSEIGQNFLLWNKRDLNGTLVPAGSYFVRFRIEDKFIIRKIQVIN